ncbi:acyl-CoA dehydrogenase family protein [Blastococcus sp. Marseille-P5729]|uniref:acyl-CoA dehydrogenase family protein n=1 Tax=Blastococcus sp. Marseille-P5729 TaxID=2086582 RepID=UPI000D0E6E53|nr:acyl-CoA dehydrogenase family protein [Blastococcus sp. Marseille-P5729]
MDLELTDEQRELASTVGRMMKERYDAEKRDAILASEPGYSDDMWGRYAELGALALPFAEEYGGADMGFGEVAVVLEEFGKALVLEPYVSTVLLGGGLVNEAGTDEQKSELLGGIAEGSLKLAFAAQEPGQRYDLTSPTTTASGSGDSYTVSGEKSGVLGGDSADKLIVSASVDGEVGLFVVDAQGEGVTLMPLKQADGLGAANVLLKDAPAQRLGSGDAKQTIQKVVDVATAGLCSEAVGAMETALKMTGEYLHTRVQFGKPIGINQALQHRAADMYVSLELAKSMALFARLAASSYGENSHRDITAAKIEIDKCAQHISQEAIQMHGGIGMTMEYPIGHYAKRLTVIMRTFNDSDALVEELAESGGLIKPSAEV